MQQKTRPIFEVGRELDAIANLGAHLEGWARVLNPEQIAALGGKLPSWCEPSTSNCGPGTTPGGSFSGKRTAGRCSTASNAWKTAPGCILLKSCKNYFKNSTGKNCGFSSA